MRMIDKALRILLAIALLAIYSCSPQQAQMPTQFTPTPIPPQGNPDYIIRPGDQLEIKSFYNPEINEQVIVRPDGKIALQLVDEIEAAGLTPAQLDDRLTTEYARELQDPVITVIVRTFADRHIYVGGEVNRQGIIAFSPRMTPLMAVINAGGFKETAKMEHTILIRKQPDNSPQPIALDLKAAMYGKSGQADFLLQPHDIIFVPKTAIAKANQFVNQYIERLLLFKGINFGFSYELNTTP